MSSFEPGLVHTPVTPFKRDHSIDFDTYARLIDFHLKNGADALALPTPEGEDISLTDAEQRDLIEFALQQVKGRVPVIAHISDAGTTIAVERAQFAERAGAAAIVSHPPYFWHPKPAMVLEHLVQIGSSVKVPFYVYNPVVESVGTHMSTELTMQLIERVPNFVGFVDANMDWVDMIEIVSGAQQLRPGFQLMPAADFIVSASVIGGRGAFSPLSAIAPKLVRHVYDLCKREEYVEARRGQENLAALHHVLKHPRLETGLKGALRVFGRDCGDVRPPNKPLGETQRGALDDALVQMRFLEGEPRGW